MNAIDEIYVTIQKLLDSDKTAYQIERDTGISRAKIGRLKNGKNDLNNLSLASTKALYEYAINLNSEGFYTMSEINWEIIDLIERKMAHSIQQLGYLFEDISEGVSEEININKMNYLLSNLVNQKNIYDIELLRYKKQSEIAETEGYLELKNLIFDLDKLLNNHTIYDKADYSNLNRTAKFLSKSKIYEHSFRNLT